MVVPADREEPMSLPRIAVTMGDPAGVGPEICLRLLAHEEAKSICSPIVFGDAGVMRRVSERLSLPFTATVMSLADWRAAGKEARGPVLVDLKCIGVDEFVPGRVSARCGDAAYRYVVASIESALAKEVDAVATAPINKEALHAAGHRYPGHTEIFAERMHAKRSCMMLTSEELTCSFVTVHVGYRDVPGLLSVSRIRDVLELTAAAMRRLRGRAPRLAVCGLNPHAGEHGLFGDGEEEKFIVPAIEAVRQAGCEIDGPLPPDTAFLASRRSHTDAYVCMYHDQGHIPLKALAFDSAINTTLGLPVVRTSVDHGTAFDIAWQGRASAKSLFEAVKLAAKLSSPEQ
jgi:4-hydroxythreonine-4-phosphate dehydrogenase